MAELQLRIYYHGWGGVLGWMKCKIRLISVRYGLGWALGLAELDNTAELGHMGLELGLNLSFEDFPGVLTLKQLNLVFFIICPCYIPLSSL